MAEEIPASVPPIRSELPPQLTPEQVAEMKRIAKERAIQQITQQRLATGGVPQQQPVPVRVPPTVPQPVPPQVVYVRRPLTVAEIIIVFVISCGIVTGGQFVWQGLTNFLPRLEIKLK